MVRRLRRGTWAPEREPAIDASHCWNTMRSCSRALSAPRQRCSFSAAIARVWSPMGVHPRTAEAGSTSFPEAFA